MTDFDQAATQLPRDVIDRMREAVATGRWPDGRTLTDEQRQTSLQAVIAWEAVNLPPEERIGFMPTADCGSAATPQPSEVMPIRMVDQHDD